MHVGHDAVDPVTIFMKFIITKFILNDQVNHQRSTDTNRKAQDIYEGKYPVLPEISEGYGKEIFYHGDLVTGRWFVRQSQKLQTTAYLYQQDTVLL